MPGDFFIFKKLPVLQAALRVMVFFPVPALVTFGVSIHRDMTEIDKTVFFAGDK